MKTIMKQLFDKVIYAHISVIIFVLALSIIMPACKSGNEDLPSEVLPNEEPADLTAVQRRLSNEQLEGIAVGRVFDSKAKSLKSVDETPIRINYPFDFVKINGSIHHLVSQGADFRFLNQICGKGEIDIFLAAFGTFSYADETKDENNLIPRVSDGLIVFRGEQGIYSCMVNGGLPDGVGVVFSSHKRFSGNSVEKDFTPPLYEFSIKTENNVTSLGCRVVVDKDGNYANQSFKWTKLQDNGIISSENMFSLNELTNMPETSQQCTITDIGENYFMVNGEYNLEKICFDEYTLFFTGEQPAQSTDFAEGDAITVTFDKLYARYNPKVAVATTIVK